MTFHSLCKWQFDFKQKEGRETSFLKKIKYFSVSRSYDRSSRSLDQDSPSKKKFQTNYASTTHLMTSKKVPSSLQTKPSDLETTVFYIPGVDVKVQALGPGVRGHILGVCICFLSPRLSPRWLHGSGVSKVQGFSLTCEHLKGTL